jgi:hypothetical protein
MPELETIIGIGVMVGGISYAIGMIISSRKKGTGDALGIAIDEIEVVKGRADRLEKELIAVQAEVHALQKENDILRQLLVTRSDLDERLIAKLEESLGKQTRRLVEVIREGRVA